MIMDLLAYIPCLRLGSPALYGLAFGSSSSSKFSSSFYVVYTCGTLGTYGLMMLPEEEWQCSQ